MTKRWSNTDIKKQKLARASSVSTGGKITLTAPPWESSNDHITYNPNAEPRLATDPARSGTVGIRQYQGRRKSIR
nr:hypothetical protein 4 [Bacilli bacterium]